MSEYTDEKEALEKTMKKQFSVKDVLALAHFALDNLIEHRTYRENVYVCRSCDNETASKYVLEHFDDCIVHTAKRLLEECEK